MKRYLLFINYLTVALLTISLFTSNVSADDTEIIDVRDDFASTYLSNYVTTFYNSENNNFPSSEANTVIQTKDGYMWFGTYNGLVQFDGEKYNIWDTVSPTGFGSSNVRVLHEDVNGVLWIGTNDRGIVKYENGNFTIYNKESGILSNTIRDIASTDDGEIYCATPEGIFYIDTKNNDSINPISLNPTETGAQPFVIALCSDLQKNIYYILNNGDLFVYTNDGRTLNFTSEDLFYSIKTLSNGSVLVGTQNDNVYFIDFDGENFKMNIKHTHLKNITSAYQDHNGFTWVVSGDGIGFFDESLSYHNVGNLNQTGFYTDICGDYENGYWITSSNGGVVKLSESAFTNVNQLYNVDTGTVNAILKHNEQLYIGTNTGMFILDKNGRQIETDFTDTIKSRVRGIFIDSKENIWICTYSDNGVIRYNPITKETKSWLAADGLVSEKTRCMTELQNGVIAIGTGGGVTFIKDDEIITANQAFDTDAVLELPDMMILSLVCSTDGTLYMGTDGNGIYAVNKNGTIKYKEENGLSGEVILRMAVNPKSNGIWVSTSNGLCYIFDDKTVSLIEKVPQYSFLDIIQYEDELILTTSTMIIRTHADSLIYPEIPFEHTVIDKSMGLKSSINANSCNWIDSDGNLYFCCDNGINSYNLNNEKSAFIPYAGLTKIDIDGIEYTNFSDSIIIPNNATRITFDFSYLSYGLMSDATLYYILEGQDETETAIVKTIGETFDVSYTNLRGGNYTLKLKTMDSNGNIGNEITFDLKKEYHFYEHIYVWVIAAVIILILIIFTIIFTVRLKSKKHYQKQQEYRTIISQALTAISNTIDAKDAYTSGHSSRVATYSVEIARRLGMDQNFMENLYYIGLLHDVGKIAIPNEILNKPDRLTDDEYKKMKEHPRIGLEILKDITTINNLTAGAAEHHERWDGNGYYQGISGESISLEGRIIAAADAYDAMSTDRSYRKALSKQIILDEFKHWRGKQFDPKIADIVIEMIDQDYFDSININQIIGLNEQAETLLLNA